MFHLLFDTYILTIMYILILMFGLLGGSVTSNKYNIDILSNYKVVTAKMLALLQLSICTPSRYGATLVFI